MTLQRQFTLIKGTLKPEKRVLPRFPFCFMTFKSSHKECDHVFEVKDISPSGMQLMLKDGGHKFNAGNVLEGRLHWQANELTLKGRVVWVTKSRIGITFEDEKDFQKKWPDFFSIERVVKALKPIHLNSMDIELPQNLKFWLSADGPVEIFIWQHNDGEKSKFQIVYFNDFIEWEDGQGLKTGQLLTKRDLETPLINEDEFVFQADSFINSARLDKALELINALEFVQLSDSAIAFLKRKLSR